MSLRRALAACTAIGFALACAPAAGGNASPSAADLLATDRAWSALASAGKDADSIVSYWSDDAHLAIPGQPVVVGKAAIRQAVTGMLKIPGFHISWTTDSAVVSNDGTMGYTYGTSTMSMSDSTGAPVTTHSASLTVWRKDANGRWRCVQDFSAPGTKE